VCATTVAVNRRTRDVITCGLGVFIIPEVLPSPRIWLTIDDHAAKCGALLLCDV
jgi:hypothetical protein